MARSDKLYKLQNKLTRINDGKNMSFVDVNTLSRGESTRKRCRRTVRVQCSGTNTQSMDLSVISQVEGTCSFSVVGITIRDRYSRYQPGDGEGGGYSREGTGQGCCYVFADCIWTR